MLEADQLHIELQKNKYKIKYIHNNCKTSIEK